MKVWHYRRVLGRGSRTALLVRRGITWLVAWRPSACSRRFWPPAPVPRTLPPVAAAVSPTPSGQPMPPSFLGMSLEYQALHFYTGRDPNHVDPVFIQLLRNLVPGQSPIVRIGGNSADYSWWPIRGVLPPGAVRYSLTKGWLRMTKSLAADAGAKLIMGVNLAGGRPALAAAEARAFMEGIGTRYIDALEIGNEPDLYNNAVWYRDRRGREFFARPASYGFSTYLLGGGALAPGAAADPGRGPGAGLADLADHRPGSVPRRRAGGADDHRPPVRAARVPDAAELAAVRVDPEPAGRPLVQRPGRRRGPVRGGRSCARRPVPARRAQLGVVLGQARGLRHIRLGAMDARHAVQHGAASASTASTSTRFPAPRYEPFTPQQAAGQVAGARPPRLLRDADVRRGVPARRATAAGQRSRPARSRSGRHARPPAAPGWS